MALRERYGALLDDLQQRADEVEKELNMAMQASGKQVEDYQNLLDIKNRLETEIEQYRRLLDGEQENW